MEPRMMGRTAGARVLVATAMFLASAPVAWSAGTGLVFVSHERSDNIVILDGTDTVVGEMKTCSRPRGMRFTPDRASIIVACGNDDTIAVYDIASRTMTKRFRDIPDPETFALAPNGRDLFISNEDDSEATLLDIETGKVK